MGSKTKEKGIYSNLNKENRTIEKYLGFIPNGLIPDSNTGEISKA